MGDLSMGWTAYGASCPWSESSMGRIVSGASCLFEVVHRVTNPWRMLFMRRLVHGTNCHRPSFLGPDKMGRLVKGWVVQESSSFQVAKCQRRVLDIADCCGAIFQGNVMSKISAGLVVMRREVMRRAMAGQIVHCGRRHNDRYDSTGLFTVTYQLIYRHCTCTV
jgi:hypothetical protein